MTREEAIKILQDVQNPRIREAIYTLHPELTESEDERIRKEIIDFIQWSEDRGMTRHDYHQAKRPAVWIAWLEKQKEEGGYEAIPIENTLEYKAGFHAGREFEKQKESLHIPETCKENPDSFTDEDERIRKIITDTVFLAYGASDEYRDVLDYLDRCGIEKQKENTLLTKEFNKGLQEAILWGREGYKITSDGKTICLTQDEIDMVLAQVKQKEQKPNIEICPHSIKSKSYLEQKPVEWSEKDKLMIECCQRAIAYYKENAQRNKKGIPLPARFDVGGYLASPDEVKAWLEFLRPQSKQEWSEEDEKCRDALINICLRPRGEMDGRPWHKWADWLKSLRPQPKRNCKDCAMFLNGECTKPRWKPSEEQMEAFKNSVEHISNVYYDDMWELYEQLKKL